MGVRAFLRVFGVSLVAMFFLACAEVPQQDIDAAKAAIETARGAEAETYAPAEFGALQDSLSSAMAEIEAQNSKFALFRSYDNAKALLQATAANASTVQTLAVDNKAQVQREVQDLMVQAQTALESAKGLLAKAPRGKETAAALESIKSDLATVEASLEEVNNMISNNMFLAARDRLRMGIEKTESVSMELTQAIEKKKGARKS